MLHGDRTVNTEYTVCSKKSSTPTHIDNSVNSQRIFKILSLAHSLKNVQ